MTVNELKKELDIYIKRGQGNLEVIGYCKFKIDKTYYERHLIYLNDVYYQSGNIELELSERKEE